MLNAIYQIIRSARPRQWLKNLAVFAAPIFQGYIFEPEIFTLSLRAFFVFCALSSGAYIFNDIVDTKKDRLHPVKRNRAIASGKLSPKLAGIVVIFLYAGSIFYSYSNVGEFFAYSTTAFIFLQLIYSLFLRNIIILDALTVASAFILRVFSGAFAVNISISSWLILTTIGLSLLLAFGKRRSEKTLLADEKLETRKTLRFYPDTLLDSMISMSSAFCIISYALFTFQTSPERVSPSFAKFLPAIIQSPKWMMTTIPIVIYGVARYLYVIYEKKEGESPERVLLSDKPILIAVALWGVSVLLITYLLPR